MPTTPASVADKIVALLKDQRRPLTSREIAAFLFGRKNGHRQRVDKRLTDLTRQGRVEQLGRGGITNPYRYRIKPLLTLEGYWPL